MKYISYGEVWRMEGACEGGMVTKEVMWSNIAGMKGHKDKRR